VRRNHPDTELTLIGREPHELYNRMGVARLIHGRSAMQGLYLLPTDWYERNRVAVWLNTRAAAIERDERRVRLGTGEVLEYDRLVLATGGRATVPPIGGFGINGCFVLREAEDAMRIRAYAQEHEMRRAIVAGGGLLGLEAAHALHALGMSVSVFERSPRLLRNALDPVASEMLRSYFEALGIGITTEVEAERVEGNGRLETVVTAAGQHVASEVLLVAAGVSPNIDLAAAAGLAVNRGVIVDDHLRTSDPSIYAVGDVAEFDGRVWGLWPVAVAQAQVAAVNIAGGDRSFEDEIPTTILKGVGLDVVSFGRIEGQGDDRVIADRGDSGGAYRKLVFADGRIAGGIFLGFGDDAHHAQDARSAAQHFGDAEIDSLAAGDWSPLRQRSMVPA
jgi:nitrite reductase (NADH) large subunit